MADKNKTAPLDTITMQDLLKMFTAQIHQSLRVCFIPEHIFLQVC